jgi:hypothetical protein
VDLPDQGRGHEPHWRIGAVLNVDARMQPGKLIVSTSIAVFAAFATPAAAAPCAGFTDVDSSSGFCADVEWIKNRAVTTGCTSATLYCPSQVVTRASMAIFLNRLANALTPATEGGILSGQGVDLDATPIVCQQPQFPVTGYPRLAHGHAVAVVSGLVGAVQVGVTFVESTDNGANYTPVSPTLATDVTTTAPASVAIILPPRTLAVGSSYRYALRLNRAGGVAAAGTDTHVSCEIKVFFENRNGTSSPFDEDDDEML